MTNKRLLTCIATSTIVLAASSLRFQSLAMKQHTLSRVALKAPGRQAHEFRAAGGDFLLDGTPFRIISGEMDYARIPRPYWRVRLLMARAMGLNAVTTSVFWNLHEPVPEHYNFSDNNDIAEFVRIAQEEGLYVIVRPGPYIGSGWELGGIPAWLLKDRSIALRTIDPKYMGPAARWIKRLGMELGPLQIGSGGPILMIQVEEAYGTYGKDSRYMEQTRQSFLDAGFTKVQLYTGDGFGEIQNGSIPELPIGVSLSADYPDASALAFAAVKKLRPLGPFFCNELAIGGYEGWGAEPQKTNVDVEAENLAWILNEGYSVSIHFFHGGTNFGLMSGAAANYYGHGYLPFETSHDSEAPLDESGRPTPRFYRLRDVILKATGVEPPTIPKVDSPIHLRPFKLTEAVSLWSVLPKAIDLPTPPTMEDLGQDYGYILYRATTTVRDSDTGYLKIHDLGLLYVDGQPQPGMVLETSTGAHIVPYDRRLGETVVHKEDLAKAQVRGLVANTLDSSALDDPPLNQGLSYLDRDITIDLLVENTGRVSSSHEISTERKGVLSYVPPPGHLKWFTYSLPMDSSSSLPFKKVLCTGPCFYRAKINVSTPGDTFLDTSELMKGQAWVNGHALGRFWRIGPQKTLYVPGAWLNKGENEFIIFDVDGHPFAKLQGLQAPQLGH